MKKLLKYKLVAVLAAVLLLLLAVTVASAHGLDADKLDNAGWDCIPIPVAGVFEPHCFPPNSFPPTPGPSGELPASIQVMVFGEDGHPFRGTELLIRGDLFEKGQDQPCPQDGGAYHDLSGEGLPYYACHHYDTSQ
jgi:hypothetical protein